MKNWEVTYYTVETDASSGQNYGVETLKTKIVKAHTEEEANKVFLKEYGEEGTALNKIKSTKEV